MLLFMTKMMLQIMMNMLAIPPRLISTLSMAVVEQNWRLSPTAAHVPTNLAIHKECDLDESDEMTMKVMMMTR